MNNSKKLISIILKGISLAMGIAVFVLSLLGKIDTNDSIKLLSIGMIVNGLYLFQEK
ncbi:MAG: hypothetical protein ACLKAO_11320 [Alkaliphilus sp.]